MGKVEADQPWEAGWTDICWILTPSPIMDGLTWAARSCVRDFTGAASSPIGAPAAQDRVRGINYPYSELCHMQLQSRARHRASKLASLF